jgi:hypothetical protein
MSSLFNVYKKISKKYGAKSNFEYIPIISNQNKYISQIKSTKNIYQRNKDKYLDYFIQENNNMNITNKMKPRRYYTYLNKINNNPNYLSHNLNEDIKNQNNIRIRQMKIDSNLSRYNNYFLTGYLLKNKYISDITEDKKNSEKMEKVDNKINGMIKDLNIYQSMKSDLSNNLSTSATFRINKKIFNKHGIRLFHKNMSTKNIFPKKLSKDMYLYKKIFFYADKKKKIKSEHKLDNKLNIIYSEDENQYRQNLHKLNSIYKLLGKKKIYNIELSQSENKVKFLQEKVDFMKRIVDYAYPNMVLKKIKEHDKIILDKNVVAPPDIITSKINRKRCSKKSDDISKGLEKSFNVQKCVFSGFDLMKKN